MFFLPSCEVRLGSSHKQNDGATLLLHSLRFIGGEQANPSANRSNAVAMLHVLYL